jgi:holo-[acyl-carrier protein] synthase
MKQAFLYSGVDIVKVSRIEHLFSQRENNIRRVFTPAEIKYCQNKRHKFQHLAARFAAKEAMLKAIGTGWADGVRWKDIEVINDESGRPYLNLYGKVRDIVDRMKVENITISLSHCSEYAIAQVILLCRIPDFRQI